MLTEERPLDRKVLTGLACLFLLAVLAWGAGCSSTGGGLEDPGTATPDVLADTDWSSDAAGFDPGPSQDPGTDSGNSEVIYYELPIFDTGSDPGQTDPGQPDPGPPPITNPGGPGKLAFFQSSGEILAGGKSIPLTLYLPEGNGPFPVIVFTHGFQLGPGDYKTTADHLASWGFVVVLPSLPGSLFSPSTHKTLKEYLIAILDWIQDKADDPSGPLAGKADAEAIGLAGHSMGGKISLLTASADGRPKAVFGVDPVDAAGGPFGGDPVDYPSVTPELMPQIMVPLGLLGETVNATCSGFLCQACAPQEDNFQQYYIHATSPAIEIEVVGASHMSFLDNPDCGLACSVCPKGTDDPDVTRMLTRRYLTAFFNVYLKSEAPFADYLTGAAMAEDATAGLVLTDSKNGF